MPRRDRVRWPKFGRGGSATSCYSRLGKNTIPACVKYTGCPAPFPVVWCTTYDNGHGGKDKITTDRSDDMMGGYQRFFEQDVPRYAP